MSYKGSIFVSLLKLNLQKKLIRNWMISSVDSEKWIKFTLCHDIYEYRETECPRRKWKNFKMKLTLAGIVCWNEVQNFSNNLLAVTECQQKGIHFRTFDTGKKVAKVKAQTLEFNSCLVQSQLLTFCVHVYLEK